MRKGQLRVCSRDMLLRFLVLVVLPHQPHAQCLGGNFDCPCISSYAGFNVSKTQSGDLVVDVSGTPYNYGTSYGLDKCSAHDRGTAPYCNVAGAPSWCSSLWCYVNASECALLSSPSPYNQNAVAMHYSYSTCEEEDRFTDRYTQRAGTIHLCSVFSEHSAVLDEVVSISGAQRACGNTRTHTQIEAMMDAVNALNGGLGFAMESGLIMRHYKFNYTYLTYPFGEWNTVGRNLSMQLFSSGRCDVIVGMANGCPDPEIMDQALVANESKLLLTYLLTYLLTCLLTYLSGTRRQRVGAHLHHRPRTAAGAHISRRGAAVLLLGARALRYLCRTGSPPVIPCATRKLRSNPRANSPRRLPTRLPPMPMPMHVPMPVPMPMPMPML